MKLKFLHRPPRARCLSYPNMGAAAMDIRTPTSEPSFQIDNNWISFTALMASVYVINILGFYTQIWSGKFYCFGFYKFYSFVLFVLIVMDFKVVIEQIQLVEIGECSHLLLKVISQIEDPKYIFINILNFILIGNRREINLIFF